MNILLMSPEKRKRIAYLRRMIREAKAEQKASRSLIYQMSIIEMQEELDKLTEAGK